MLHALDDDPYHQTPQPFSHPATDSPNVYDRYFFSGYSRDGSVFFVVAFGVYPNRQVLDGAFGVVRDGVQHNVRASRACPRDRTETTGADRRHRQIGGSRTESDGSRWSGSDTGTRSGGTADGSAPTWIAWSGRIITLNSVIMPSSSQVMMST